MSEGRRLHGWMAMRFVRVAVIGAVALAFAGCVDVVQYISGDSSNIDVFLRLTLAKGAFELMGSMSGESKDVDTMFADDFKVDRDDVLSDLPPGVSADFSTVDTDSEYGFELRYSGDRAQLAALPDASGALVPRVTPRGMSIPFPDTGSEAKQAEGSAAQYADAVLGGAKYRALISKRLVSRISAARVVGDEVTDATVTDLPDVWMIEFPISLWLGAKHAPTLEIIF